MGGVLWCASKTEQVGEGDQESHNSIMCLYGENIKTFQGNLHFASAFILIFDISTDGC